MPPTAVTGSAERWGPLWGARPADWALSEDQQVPTYEDALARVRLEPGQLVLDIGCGAGAFLQLVAEQGARAFGLDASEALLDLARSRGLDADLRVGDMEALPYDDDTFDLVTGFNAFFFANDIVAALREAGRVAKPGAAVVIQVWGPHEHNDLEAMKEIVRPFFPRGRRSAARARLLEARRARRPCDQGRSRPRDHVRQHLADRVPGREILGRALIAPAGIAVLIGPDREQEVKDAIVRGSPGSVRPDGGYRLQNTYRSLIARAR